MAAISTTSNTLRLFLRRKIAGLASNIAIVLADAVHYYLRQDPGAGLARSGTLQAAIAVLSAASVCASASPPWPPSARRRLVAGLATGGIPPISPARQVVSWPAS